MNELPIVLINSLRNKAGETKKAKSSTTKSPKTNPSTSKSPKTKVSKSKKPNIKPTHTNISSVDD